MTDQLRTISSDKLKLSDVPTTSTGWHEISLFALTFDKNEYDPYSIFENDFHSINCDSSISYLRARLFAEQRRWNHYGREIDEHSRAGVNNILEILRKRLGESS